MTLQNVLVKMIKEIKDQSEGNPDVNCLSALNFLFRRKKCTNFCDGVSPEDLVGRWYKLVMKVVLSEIPAILSNEHHPFAKILRDEAKRMEKANGKISVEQLLGCTLERFLKYDFMLDC